MNKKTEEAIKRVRAQEGFGRYESKEVGLYQTEDVGFLLEAYDEAILKMELQTMFVEILVRDHAEGETGKILQNLLDYMNMGEDNDVPTT